VRLPGFTAEAALDRTGTHYRMAGDVLRAGEGIQPALRPRNCFQNCLADQCFSEDDPYCYDNCRCVCYGHPGRTCWLT
jgi:hypothetical protein